MISLSVRASVRPCVRSKSCLPQRFLLFFSHRFMTFGMYVHFQETMCRIPILKITHNYHTSIFPVLQVHKFHLHMTHWRGPHEMTPISMVSSIYKCRRISFKIIFMRYFICLFFPPRQCIKMNAE